MIFAVAVTVAVAVALWAPPLIPPILQHTAGAPSPQCPTHWRVPVIMRVMLDAFGEPVASECILDVFFLLGGLSREPVASTSYF